MGKRDNRKDEQMNVYPLHERRPYRMVVFAQGFRVVRRYKRFTKIEPSVYAYMGWTPTQHYQEERLPSAGSFLFPGLHAVRKAAMAELAKPEVQSVSIRTNQDRNVHRFVK